MYIYIYIYKDIYIYIYIYIKHFPCYVCFITDTDLGRKVKNFFVSYQRLKPQTHSVSIGLFCYGFSFSEHFNIQLPEAVSSYSKP